MNKFEREGTSSCITMDFVNASAEDVNNDDKDGSFDVVVTSNVGKPTGPHATTRFSAYEVDSGVFTVRKDRRFLDDTLNLRLVQAFFANSLWQDYWVVALGPVQNGQYEWSVATDATGTLFFVTARSVEDYLTLYQADVELFCSTNKLPVPQYRGAGDDDYWQGHYSYNRNSYASKHENADATFNGAYNVEVVQTPLCAYSSF